MDVQGSEEDVTRCTLALHLVGGEIDTPDQSRGADSDSEPGNGTARRRAGVALASRCRP